MRLHYGWTVLVATIWIILLHDSFQESITTETRNRRIENNRVNEYRVKVSSPNRDSRYASDVNGAKVSKGETILHQDKGKRQIVLGNDNKTIEVDRRSVQRDKVKQDNIPFHIVDINYIPLKSTAHNGNDNETNIFLTSQKANITPVSGKKEGMPSARRSKAKDSQIRKADTPQASGDVIVTHKSQPLMTEYIGRILKLPDIRDTQRTTPVTEYSKRKINTEDLFSETDDSTINYKSVHKIVDSSSSGKRNKSVNESETIKRNYINSEIQYGKNITIVKNIADVDKISKPNEIDTSKAVNNEQNLYEASINFLEHNSLKKKINHVSTSSDEKNNVASAGNHNSNIISENISQSLFENSSLQIPQRNDNPEFESDLNNLREIKRLKYSRSQMGNVELEPQEQEEKNDNYDDSQMHNRKSASSRKRIAVNSKNFRVNNGNETMENEFFSGARSANARNIEKEIETIAERTGTKKISGDVNFVDKVVNLDSETGNRIHRSIVKIGFAGLQTEQRAHKTVTSAESTRGLKLQQTQTRVQEQEQKKQVKEIFLTSESTTIDGSFTLGDGVSEMIALENSNASLMAVQVQLENNVSMSISAVTPKRTGNITLSRKDLKDTLVTRKIKSSCDNIFSSKGLPKVSIPMSEPTGAKVANDNTERRDAMERNVVNFIIEKIDRRGASGTLSTIDSPFAEQHPGDDGLDDDDGEKIHLDCNGKNGDIEDLRMQRPLQSQRQRSSFQGHRGKAVFQNNDQKLSNNFGVAPVHSKLVMALMSDTSTTTTAAGIINSPVAADASGTSEKRKNVWPHRMPNNNAITSKPASSTAKPFISILLKYGRNEITGVTGPDTFVGNENQGVRHDQTNNDGSVEQTNYIRIVKIDETNSSSPVNGLKLRESTKVNDSLSEVRGERRNHIDGEIPAIEGCDSCKIAGIVKRTNVARSGNPSINDDRQHQRNVNGYNEKSKTPTNNSQKLLQSIVKKVNESSVDPEVVGDQMSPLRNSSTELKMIDHTKLEIRVEEKSKWENTRELIHNQQPIIITPEAQNFILSQKSEIHLPSNAKKLRSTVASDSLEPALNDENKNIMNSSLTAPYLFPLRAKNISIPISNTVNEQQDHEEVMARFAGLSTGSDLKLSNNVGRIPWEHENFTTYAISQTKPLSSTVRNRKSLGHVAGTVSATSSTKIDGIESIDRALYHDRYSMRKELFQQSDLRVSSTMPSDHRHQEKDNLATKQIKTEFTSQDSISISIAVPTTNYLSYRTSSETVVPEEVGDIEVTQAFPATSEVNSETSTDRIVMEDFSTTLIADLSGVNLTVPSFDNYDQELGKSLKQLKSSRVKDLESTSLQHQQIERLHENSGIVLGNGGRRTLNHTDRDNSTRVTATLNQWPVKHSAVVEGDLVLGGLMMVHEREDSVTCGPVMPQGGVQALEAMLYTLDWLNKRDLVPGVKIGAHILDDCDKDTYGLEMAVDFIKGSISNIDGAEYHCNKTAVRKVISGVVGAASSVTSIQVANLLRLFRIPQVSFFSTSPELSNKMRFEYFTRTIPSDHYQVKAMVDIVLLMGWSYVSIIYEESNYGEKAFEELEKLLGKHQICIAVKEKLSKDSGVAKAHVYDNIVQKLLTKPRARGCIIFGSDQEVAGVMKAVNRCNATGAFSWIGSDGWSARSLVSDGNEAEVEGTLSVQPQANPVEGFEDYFLNLTVENNRRNPWFVEFWEDHFKCRYPNSTQTPYNKNYTNECTTKERLTKQNTAFEDQLQFVSDAVMAFAYAFRNMHKDLCNGKPGLCDAMKPTKGTELLSYLRTVEFRGLSGDKFQFDKNGDGPARYNIIHFKQVSPGKYKWIRVGKYLEGELRLNMSEIQFRLGHPQPPESVCSLPCGVGQEKKYVEGESCCWHCFNCTQYQIRHETDEKQCVLCPQGTVPDETHSYCRDIPEEFLRPESGWAIGAMSFSATGILITLFVGGVFLKHNDTPIVRASGRELSYVLLTGILLCYLVTFALVLRPNDIVCSIQRFSAGFCFTVVYAALLTKTNRIARIFNAGKHSAKRPSFISPRSQLIICSMLVAVQILINAVWMVIDPAKAMHHYPTREDNLLVCNSYRDASYMIAFTYPIILIVVCTVYAVLTRKIPEAFNESKHIGFTMYTTCVIWLAFVPLYFATGSHVALRITSMSVTISLSASVTIACLFSPKLYIILIHPERNVRPNMMNNRYSTPKASGVTNASSMMAPVTLTAVTCDQNKAVKKHVISTIDCSTQSEQFEMELKDQKNGQLPPTMATRSTQTLLNNNGKELSPLTSPVIKDISIEETKGSMKALNNAKMGNGPITQNEVPL